jgi:hypothetical protein
VGIKGIAFVRHDGSARAGDGGVAIGWQNGVASAGKGGLIILGYRDPNTGRVVLKVDHTEPDGKLEPGLNYKLDKNFEFVAVRKR